MRVIKGFKAEVELVKDAEKRELECLVDEQRLTEDASKEARRIRNRLSRISMVA
jgi:hypothetical protein